MKKLLTAIFAFCGLFCFQPLLAQHQCGTSVEAQAENLRRLDANRRAAAMGLISSSREELVYVPIKFHLVAKTDGTGRVNLTQIFDMLCNLNESYEDQEIQFYIKYPFNEINNDALYNYPGGTGGRLQIQANKVNNAMNIFITQSTGSSPQDPGTNTLGYYQPAFPQNDYIVIRKTATFGNTAAHEVGHFFSLAHPFFGWENNPWDPDEHGMQVGTFSPNSSSQFQIYNERVNMTNCQTAADYICDTPPDYLFAFSDGQNGCTSWNGGAMDPLGEIVDPQETNMMSYFDNCAQYIFTEDQKEAIRNDYDSADRAYVRTSYVPSTVDITSAPSLLSPIGGATTSGYDQVALDWEEVTGAEFYYLEVDFIQNFAGQPQRFLVEGTYKVVEGLNPNVTYYWRVTPFGEYATCDLPTSSIESFKTGTSVSATEIDFVSGWNLSPNPLEQGNELFIEVDAQQGFDANINVYTATGKLVKTVQNHRFAAGTDHYHLNVAGMSAGMYLVSIQTEAGQMTKRVVIAR